MKQNVVVGDLRVGMYLELPLSWTEHNFLRSKFKLTSPEQIAAKLTEMEIEAVARYLSGK